MPLSDDLSSLFGPAPQGAAANSQIRQGVILSFSTADGSNTVGVGASILTNVPMLLTGAEVKYTVGDPVLLLILGNTYMILGKVAMVGSSTFASASIATASANNSVTGFSPSTSDVLLTSCTVTVPSWANTALVTAIGTVTIIGGVGTGFTDCAANTGITGFAFPPQVLFSAPNGGQPGTGVQGETRTLTGLTGGSTIRAEVDGGANPSPGAVAANQATIRMSAIFYKQ